MRYGRDWLRAAGVVAVVVLGIGWAAPAWAQNCKPCNTSFLFLPLAGVFFFPPSPVVPAGENVLLDGHVRKHYDLTITDTAFTYRRKEDAIAVEARLDGIYVIRTNLPEAALTAEQTVSAYKSLAQVERAFRCLKTIDLEIRPVFHWTAPRVRAHVFLCMLAYYVEFRMRSRLAPILFDDHDS